MKKYISVILAAVTLCACAKGGIPEETDAVSTVPVTAARTEAQTAGTAAETAPTYTYTSYPDHSDSAVIDMNDPPVGIAGALEGVKYLEVKNASGDDLGFIRDMDSLRELNLYNCASAEKFIDAVKGADVRLDRLNYGTDICREDEAEALFRAFPSAEVTYSEQFGFTSAPQEGFLYYTVTDVVRGNAVAANFDNMTDSAGHISGLSILRRENGGWVSYPFADGSERIELDIDVESRGKYTYAVPANLFDSVSAPCGRYKTVFTLNGEDMESEFFINGGEKPFPMTEENVRALFESAVYGDNDGNNVLSRPVPEFLTDEQLEAYNRAFLLTNNFFGTDIYLSEEYAAEHTAEDLINILSRGYTRGYAESLAAGTYIDESGSLVPVYGGRGSDITFGAIEFFPVYENDSEVLFRGEVMHTHGDNPYFVSYAEHNYHMVKTDDGWRFDVFQLWK